MKRIFLAFMALIALSASAKGVMDVAGTMYDVDTLFHAKIGPGTMQTSLYLTCGNKHIRVFYATIDLTNPHINVRAVSGGDMMAGGETVRQMSTRKTTQTGKQYFCGVNGDFWWTSGTTSRGQSRVGEPCGPSMGNGIIYKAASWSEYNYIIDSNQIPMLGQVVFGGTLKNAAGETVNLGGVNVDASNNVVTLYNPTFYKGTNQSGVTEVQVRFVDGDEAFGFGKTCKVEVVNEPSSAGDMDVPSTGLVLSGKGTTATFIGALKPGDQLDLTYTATLNGQAISPSEIVSGNPWALKDGEVVHGDGSVHPRTVLGYTQDRKTAVFLVADGRSALSDGATTDALGSMMKYAGCWDAVNVDGGGSTTLYTTMLGVRNKPSDGSERADSNGIFVVCEAPDDSEVAAIDFQDFALRSPKYGVYTPVIYGYNQYGLLIDTNLKGAKLSCDPELGTIIGDTTFYANGSLAEGWLTVTYNGISTKKMVYIQNSVDKIAITNDSIINDGLRDYAIDVQSYVGETIMPINPAALTWYSTNNDVVQVDANTGVLRGLTNGVAEVVGKIGDVTDTLKVIVEQPLAHKMPIDPNLDIETWKITQTGGTGAVATANGNGIDYTYTGASGRAPKILLSKTLRLWSLPDELVLTVQNPDKAPIKNMVFGLRANGESMTYQTVQPDTLPGEVEILTATVKMSDWLDADDMGNYPLTLSSIQLNMNTSTTGQQYTLHFTEMATVYNRVAETPLAGDVNGDGVVNVADVTELVNLILAGTTSIAAADVNGDGEINVSDVTAVVNIILTVNE